MNLPDTTDNNLGNYSLADIPIEDVENLKSIANVRLNEKVSKNPKLLIYPECASSISDNLLDDTVISLEEDNTRLRTGNVMGFIGINGTRLSITSRFANDKQHDYFLHYMLLRVFHINLFDWKYSTDEESVFDFLLYLFPSFLNTALRQGLYKEYRKFQHDDANVKGTIDVTRYINQDIPFSGKIAYNTKEHSYDNHITELIRHTIECIAQHPFGKNILKNSKETSDNVALIRNMTVSYQKGLLRKVLAENIRPLHHPYFSKYKPLQRLCIHILRHKEITYGQKGNEVYGILFDGAWLWEEYIGLVLKDSFNHYYTNKVKRFPLFTGKFFHVVPDYISKDKKIVADAKYINLAPLDFGESRNTAIYYKTITYMLRFNSDLGKLFYPSKRQEERKEQLKIDETNKILEKIPMYVNAHCDTFSEFISVMSKTEQIFVNDVYAT